MRLNHLLLVTTSLITFMRSTAHQVELEQISKVFNRTDIWSCLGHSRIDYPLILSIGHAKTRLPRLQPWRATSIARSDPPPGSKFYPLRPLRERAFVAFVPVDVPNWD
ncbi:hypothetical protein Y032_0161g3394 [Ancylostoma ceylanicum]|uniref:Secreted protein n=1 Tax=Ancylostoma ceylanicum TaxID=53326 RepID=A0A016SYA2_9BILA|nr:hypothetical protein Y032_0161g3394 [Ancylostoma ceylanicum]